MRISTGCVAFPMKSTPRTVQCYHCRGRFEVPGRAQSTFCPKCHKALIVGDVIVDRLKGPLKEVRTCGRVAVGKKGRIIAELIEAHGGIECEGAIEAKRVVSGGPVSLGSRALFKGALAAPSLSVSKGARVSSTGMQLPADPLGVSDLLDRS